MSKTDKNTTSESKTKGVKYVQLTPKAAKTMKEQLALESLPPVQPDAHGVNYVQLLGKTTLGNDNDFSSSEMD